jgi:hypothetical protein
VYLVVQSKKTGEVWTLCDNRQNMLVQDDATRKFLQGGTK